MSAATTPLSTPCGEAFSFGTKAETLFRIGPRLRGATIPESRHFTVEQWTHSRSRILRELGGTFGAALVVVRSSALVEDGAKSSMAGAFLSVLTVRCAEQAELASAIDQVVDSMTGHPRDQVLVQRMATTTVLSGVITTCDLAHGAPYFCIEYEDESGRTDVVTSGSAIHKGLYVYRDADPRLIRSPRVASFLALARELESLCECPALDIEFGMEPDGALILFQVRRIALSQDWHPGIGIRVRREIFHLAQAVQRFTGPRPGVLGQRSLLAVMTDWNPAEMIGTTARPLAASLYREIITRDTWCRARQMMGYRPVPHPELMVTLSNHPYIDVRQSFNSFLPATLADSVGERLVDAWLDRLEAHPELHDKVEFEIVSTCLDFCFDEDFEQRYAGLLVPAELNAYRDALRAVTRQALRSQAAGSLKWALEQAAAVEDLEQQDAQAVRAEGWLDQASVLVNRCRNVGALAFAVAARHAFIGESLLRTAVRRGALSPERIAEFKRSIRTVAGAMVGSYAQACRGELAREDFLRVYGHLRPGTYEITSLRYDEREDLFDTEAGFGDLGESASFELTAAEALGLDELLRGSGLDVVDPEGLIAYIRQATVAREYVKFVFTRSLSNALQALGHWGREQGLSREDLSYIPWEQCADFLVQPPVDDADRYLLEKAEQGRRRMAAAQAFRLSHMISGVKDLHVVTHSRSVPNFVGSGRASGPVVVLTPETSASILIKGRIVCIESADPGFDWIFTKSPGALITKYGGANSHMAIRCAEIGVPAAIGCGQQMFERVLAAGQAELDCAQRVLKALVGT